MWMRPRRARGSAGAVEEAGDVALVGHDVEDPHAAAALAADGDVDSEHAGEEADSRGSVSALTRGAGGARVVVVVEVQG